jgi:hypothetical protein
MVQGQRGEPAIVTAAVILALVYLTYRLANLWLTAFCRLGDDATELRRDVEDDGDGGRVPESWRANRRG